MRLVVLDPSGNANKEGNGTTGMARFEDGELKYFWSVKAENFPSQETYWFDIWSDIEKNHPDAVLMESYKLFGHKAKQQTGSTLDTPQLIGYLRMKCYELGYTLYFQDPQDKIRVADEQLVHMGIIEKRGRNHYCLGRPTIIHERDAIRHGIYFFRYGKGKSL